jgi:hypothetical protein
VELGTHRTDAVINAQDAWKSCSAPRCRIFPMLDREAGSSFQVETDQERTHIFPNQRQRWLGSSSSSHRIVTTPINKVKKSTTTGVGAAGCEEARLSGLGGPASKQESRRRPKDLEPLRQARTAEPIPIIIRSRLRSMHPASQNAAKPLPPCRRSSLSFSLTSISSST